MNKPKAYVIGTSVSSSLSPTIFQYWFKKYNISAEYGYKEIDKKKRSTAISEIDSKCLFTSSGRSLVGIIIARSLVL